MKVYFAPMEGITGYIYRNAHQRFFGQVDAYYTPFIVPNQTRRLTSREMNDILPEHNSGIRVVPQILTNKAEDFIWAAKKAQALGYGSVNLNLGCPSGTVFSKGRGAGFLAHPEELERFLDQVCGEMERLGMGFSVKTRIGVEDPAEFGRLLEMFNRYPLERLIIHPRVRTDYYRNHPDWEVFGMAVGESENPVCYNGDVFSLEDFKRLHETFPQVEGVMLGRGLLANPALAAMIKGYLDGTEAPEVWLSAERLREFHDGLLEAYREVIPGDKNVLFKMKELWYYLAYAFTDSEKQVKRIRKAGSMKGYLDAVERLFEECRVENGGAFPGTP